MKQLLLIPVLVSGIALAQDTQKFGGGFEAPTVNGTGGIADPIVGEIIYDDLTGDFYGRGEKGGIATWKSLSSTPNAGPSEEAGLVTNTTQSIGGNKTFTGDVSVGGNVSVTGQSTFSGGIINSGLGTDSVQLSSNIETDVLGRVYHASDSFNVALTSGVWMIQYSAAIQTMMGTYAASIPIMVNLHGRKGSGTFPTSGSADYDNSSWNSTDVFRIDAPSYMYNADAASVVRVGQVSNSTIYTVPSGETHTVTLVLVGNSSWLDGNGAKGKLMASGQASGLVEKETKILVYKLSN